MKSIRRYQLGALVAGTVVIVAAATGAHHVAVRRSLTREFDAALAAQAASLSGLLEYDTPYFEFDFAVTTMPQYAPGPNTDYFQLWIDDAVFARSSSLGAADLPSSAGTFDTPLVRDLDLPDGRRGRAVGIRFPVKTDEDAVGPNGDPPEAVVVVARSQEDLRASLTTLAAMSALEGALIFACMCILVVFTTGRAMARVRRLAEQVDEIDSTRLHHQLDGTATPDELRPIVDGLNRMLARMDDAFQRERRVNASIAHELRTPVAELRTATDVALKWPDDPKLAMKTVTNAAGIAAHMENIVTALLRLARAQSGQLVVEAAPVDLARMLATRWHEAIPPAECRGVQATLDVPSTLVAQTDPDGLSVILQNLLSNAVAHCPDGGWIRCRAAADGRAARLEIANANDTLTAEDGARLTEAFWTSSAARSNADHAGLGLTLVKAIAELLDVAVAFDVDDARFRATLTLPLASSPQDAGTARNGRAAIAR